jgi:hypothetical protein
MRRVDRAVVDVAGGDDFELMARQTWEFHQERRRRR